MSPPQPTSFDPNDYILHLIPHNFDPFLTSSTKTPHIFPPNSSNFPSFCASSFTGPCVNACTICEQMKIKLKITPSCWSLCKPAWSPLLSMLRGSNPIFNKCYKNRFSGRIEKINSGITVLYVWLILSTNSHLKHFLPQEIFSWLHSRCTQKHMRVFTLSVSYCSVITKIEMYCWIWVQPPNIMLNKKPVSDSWIVLCIQIDRQSNFNKHSYLAPWSVLTSLFCSFHLICCHATQGILPLSVSMHCRSPLQCTWTFHWTPGLWCWSCNLWPHYFQYSSYVPTK